ncbi:hypothetical protein BV898_17106 [Hypsibius exemplaris]|uniref:DOMON domain-containing protein n=1 Tax=Hypsibius exemplaris TaxID=2072580 RepID=A0A9X6NN20_HYPEX|nr:hypothetical protein BV898_17106 [Hypsibius exemplaris]
MDLEQPLVLTMGQPQTSFPNLQGLQTIAPGCLAEPAGCLDNGNCNTVASYRLDPNRPGEMVFELWRVMAPAGDQYVAMGLNPTSPSMPGTGVTACVYAQSSVDVLSSYNPFYFSMPIDNPKEGITVMQTGADGSHLYCQFSLQSKKSFRGNFSDSPVEIDLNNPLYFFVAYGQAMPSGGLTKHSVMPSTSTGQVSLAAFPNATTNGTELNSTMTAFDIAPVAQNLTNHRAIPSEGLTRQATPPTAITDCNVLKGCLAEPPGCLNRGNCNSVVSYRVNPASPGELMFELWRVMASSGDQPPVNDDLYTLHAGAYDIDLNESDTSNPSPKTLLSSSSLSEVQLASNTTATPDLSFVSMAVNSMSIFLPVFNPAITSFTGALLPSNISEAVNASAFFEFTMEGEFVPILEERNRRNRNERIWNRRNRNEQNWNMEPERTIMEQMEPERTIMEQTEPETNDNGTDGTETNKIGTNGTGTNETGKHENGTNGTDLFASFDLDPMTVVLDDADSYLGKITAGCGWEKGCMGHPDRCP